MKIAIVVPALALKAPVIVAHQLAQGFVSAGHAVTTFYFDEIREMDFPCPTRRIDFSDLSSLDGFDVVHTHCLRPDVFGWCCKMFRRNRGCFVTTIHNIVEEDLRFWYGKFYEAVFSRVWRMAWSAFDARVVLTDQALAYYKKTQPDVSYTRIYNGRSAHFPSKIDDNDLQIILKAKSKWRLIGACAVLSPIKGLEQVVLALPALPQHAFLLIGDGPSRQALITLAKSLGVSDRLIDLGRKENARDYLPFMDMYAMPSRSEGLSLALLEAVSVKVPAFCSDIPQFREVFSEDEVAYFDLDDTFGLIKAVNRIEIDGALMASRAHQRFEENYTQVVMVRNYLEYFENLQTLAHL